MKLKINLLCAFAIAASSFQVNGQDKIVLPAAADPNLEAQVTEKDRGFVEDVLEDNNKETAWLQAGVEKGTSSALTGLASKMLRDHQKVDKAFRNYMTKKNLIITDIDGTGEVNFLNVKRRKGPAWDREWTTEMISNQRKTIEMFEDAQGFASDPDLKTMVNSALTGLRSNLESLIKLKGDLGE
jgi:predicted outer membrane protein